MNKFSLFWHLKKGRKKWLFIGFILNLLLLFCLSLDAYFRPFYQHTNAFMDSNTFTIRTLDKEENRTSENILSSSLKEEEDVFSRKNPLVHFTASSWIINKSRDKVLLCFHNIYNSWSWLGGHCDNEIDCLKVAIKEAKEESGLEEFRCLTEGIFSM